MSDYLQPQSLDEALSALASDALIPVAGGTDFYPARAGKLINEAILDVSRISALRGITEIDGSWRIGATTSWTEIIEAELPPLFDALKLAAREVGGVQIQNAGTIAGNICNASPAADGVPPLLAMDAIIELSSLQATREVPLSEFITGNRATLREADEIVTAILVPKPDGYATSSFLKLGARKYLVISIVMAAATLEIAEDGTIANARIAVGACSAVAKRLPLLEAALIGQPAGSVLADIPDATHLAPLSPIDDVRATADYRQEAALTVLRKLLSGMGTDRD